MAGSLFDQLKKVGLVDEKKVKKAKKEKYQQTKQKKSKKSQGQISEVAKLVADVAEQKDERDRALNLERKQQQEQKALQAELRQVIKSNRLYDYGGDKIFNFVDEKSVKALNVNKQTYYSLVAGEVRITKFGDAYVLVPATVIDKIKQRNATVIIPLTAVDESTLDIDKDYYAQFKIPDNLIW